MRQEFSKHVRLAAFKRANGSCDVTQDALCRRFLYDQETGIFTYRIGGRGYFAGARAGALRPDGYRTISVDKVRHYEHRLAWLYVMGAWPQFTIDHIDRNPSNNRWSNLREATYSQNVANSPRRITNKSGFKGVFLESRSGRWYSQITVDSVVYSLGHFATPGAASQAYQEAATAHFGAFCEVRHAS